MNPTLYVTYIFATISTCFLILHSAARVICLVDDSANNPASHSLRANIMGTCLEICSFFALYFINFRFIPIYHDVRFVAVPKFRRSITLITVTTICAALMQLAKPFSTLVNEHNLSLYPCTLNSTSTDFMMGLISVSEPFFVELPIMVVWLIMEMRSQFLPRHAKAITEHTNRSYPRSLLREQFRVPSSCITIECLFKPLDNERVPSDVEDRQILTSVNSDATGLTNEGCENVSQQGSSESLASGGLPIPFDGELHDSNQSCSPNRMSERTKTVKRRMNNRIEIYVALLAVACAIYFGLSNLILVLYSEDKPEENEGALRGRYIQWFARMAFFTAGHLGNSQTADTNTQRRRSARYSTRSLILGRN